MSCVSIGAVCSGESWCELGWLSSCRILSTLLSILSIRWSVVRSLGLVWLFGLWIEVLTPVTVVLLVGVWLAVCCSGVCFLGVSFCGCGCCVEFPLFWGVFDVRGVLVNIFFFFVQFALYYY